ncbi:MAG: outer membrane beta-barrel protein [Deltaproteobacteria bacterium]|nr:MAG: outer membrane beta-barrel protein [Deltaproteobacteria bacterium]
MKKKLDKSASGGIVWLTITLFLSHNLLYPLDKTYGQENKEKEVPYIAVFDLEAREEVPSSAVVPLSESLRKELFNTKKFKVLDRKNMDVILKEQGLHLMGCTTSECAVEAGRLLGVDKIVTGNIAKLGNIFYVSVTITNAETGEVESIADDQSRGDIEKLFGVIRKIAGKITGEIPDVLAPEALKVNGEPADAQISLDGSILGSAPQEIKVAPGTHKIEVTKPGYKPYTRKFQVAEGKSYRISYSLEMIVESAPGIGPEVDEEEISKERIQPVQRRIRIGLKAGVNFAKFNIEEDIGENIEDFAGGEPKFKPGICLGASVTYRINNIFAVQPEVLLTMKGTKMEFDSNGSTDVDTWALNYLEIPVLAKLSIPVWSNRPHLFLGPALAIKLDAEREWEYEGNSGKDDFSEHMEDIDFGLVIGGGLDFELGRGRLSFDTRYTAGSIRIFKSEYYGEELGIRNGVVSLMLGYTF